MKNKKNTAFALLVSAAALIALTLCFSFSKGDALVLGLDRNAQSNLLPEFFSGIKSANYSEALELVSNYDSLGFEKDAGELVNRYRSALIDSYSVSVVNHNSGEHDGLYGEQIIDLTFLDSRKLLFSINEKTTEAVNDFLYQGNKLESDEQALSFVYDALNQCLDDPENYFSTERLTVQTVFEDGSWKIIIDDAFLSVLHGHIGSAAEGAVVSASDVVSSADADAAEEVPVNE